MNLTYRKRTIEVADLQSALEVVRRRYPEAYATHQNGWLVLDSDVEVLGAVSVWSSETARDRNRDPVARVF